MSIILPIALVIFSYLLGSVNSSIIVCRIMKKGDIRTHGSGNAGTTNTMRTLGKKAAVVVLIIDMLKGVIATVIARAVLTDTAAVFVLLCGFAAIIGHIFPVFFGFKGGKGVATALAVVACLKGGWGIAIVMALIAVILIAATKYMSLSVLITVAFYPLLSYIFTRDIYYIVFAFIVTVLLFIMHRDNIKRLMTGTENKMKWGKS